jgi:hypothetical protein
MEELVRINALRSLDVLQDRLKFSLWFADNVRVGPYPNFRDLSPNGWLSDYDVFVNVSDEYNAELAVELTRLGKQSHWFPLGEAWGLCMGSIYGALYILREAEKHGQRVYLHCHAGVNRSQTVADCYYFMRSGEHRPRVFCEGMEQNALQRNILNNVLPDTFTMEGWLKQMNYAVTHPMGGWLDASREQAGMPCPFGAVAPA